MCEINPAKFAEWVRLIGPCLYNDGYYFQTPEGEREFVAEGYTTILEHIEDTFVYFDVPEDWRMPVQVMAQGASYYSADSWLEKFHIA